MSQEVVESPVPTNDELPFDTRGGRVDYQPQPNTRTIAEDDNNPTNTRRRRYDFNDEVNNNSFTKPF